jgi:hypothetical protein
VESWVGSVLRLTTHDEFRELSAISTSGSLTEDERRRLEEHLQSCLECRKAVHEYETVARIVMPSLASDFPADLPALPEGWSEERAKQELFRQLDLRPPTGSVPLQLLGSSRGGYVNHAGVRKQRDLSAWLPRATAVLPYAAGIALAALIGLSGYQLGQKQRVSLAPTDQRPAPEADRLHDEIAAMSQARQLLGAQLEDRDHAIANLNGKTARQLAEIQELKNEDQRARGFFQRAQEENAQTASERDGLRRKLEQAQSDLASMQTDMESLRQQRANEAARVADLETRLARFPELLKDRDSTIEQQRELLAHDRDIRDLMGARDLYIAEVIDVGRDGDTKKPFGRVFYTKGKSLIFYAYDLDQQPGIREASTFQAWGRRGPDLAHAMNLGVFYVDNTTHKRWVLKFDEPKSLEQIDAVFVTVEPKGGSRQPSGKQLLFAYLRVEPNHP